MNHRPLSFPNWQVALVQTVPVPVRRAAYIREILTFLKYRKDRRAIATTEVAKHYLLEREQQSAGPAREALRWFYREGMRRAAAQNSKSEVRPELGAKSLDTSSSPKLHPTVQVAGSSPWRRPMQPLLASNDLGGAPWEQALIRAVRERGFLWRTEQTYREWAVRFARSIAPRSPFAAGCEEVCPS